MPGTTLPPSGSDVLSGPNGLVARVERLERRLSATSKQSRYLPSVFTYAGALVNAVESAPWYPEMNLNIFAARVSATTVPSGTCTLTLRLNGADYATTSLGSGLVTARTALALHVGIGSYLTMRVDAASSAANVSVGLEFTAA